MIDIINFKGERFDLGFSRVYNINDFNAVEARDEEKNKKILCDRKVDFIYNLEDNEKRDKFNSRSSGLNQVLCKLARDNEIAVGFNFNLALNSEDIKKRNLIVGRMIQNVRLCRKFKVKMVLFSCAKDKYEMRAAKDLAAFGRAVGMTGSEVNSSLNFRRKERLIEEVS